MSQLPSEGYQTRDFAMGLISIPLTSATLRGDVFRTLRYDCSFMAAVSPSLTSDILMQFIQSLFIVSPASLCTYQCKAGGGGGREWGGDLIVFVGPGVGRLTDLVLLEELIFESFFAQRRGDI